jgi:hypothetical protein
MLRVAGIKKNQIYSDNLFIGTVSMVFFYDKTNGVGNRALGCYHTYSCALPNEALKSLEDAGWTVARSEWCRLSAGEEQFSYWLRAPAGWATKGKDNT